MGVLSHGDSSEILMAGGAADRDFERHRHHARLFPNFHGCRFQTTSVRRFHASERFADMVLTILILGGGLWPQPAVASNHHAAQALLRLRKSCKRSENLVKHCGVIEYER